MSSFTSGSKTCISTATRRNHLRHCKKESNRYIPILPGLAQELRTHLDGRRHSYLFETNRHDRYSVRTMQSVVQSSAREAGFEKRVYPHLLRHSVATILLDSGLVPIDQVQKFLGHLQLSTTQIYAETSVRALGDNYLRALGAPRCELTIRRPGRLCKPDGRGRATARRDRRRHHSEVFHADKTGPRRGGAMPRSG